MSLGLHDTRLRRRRQFRWMIVKWLIALGAILGAGVFAYESGSTLAQREIAALRTEIDSLRAKVESLQRENTDLRADAILTERRLQEAEARYAKDVPRGRMAALLDQLKEKLAAGVTLERLEFLIAAADNPRTCSAEPATKRFIVQTPLTTGGNDSVSFADKRITITASGEPTVNAEGNREAWFDPAKPVTVH
ncbi:MAG: hypothetical protein D6826_08935, partial [Alphaproteobacteria bacterium]